MMTQVMRLPVKRTRLKREDVIDSLDLHGAMTRAELERLFKIPEGNTSIQTHIANMRGDRVIYVSSWRPPEKTGQWSPVYDLVTEKNELDAPHPPPRSRFEPSGPVAAYDIDEPVVLRGVGLKKEHVAMAATRSQGMGMWGDLLRGAKPAGFTRVPRQKGAT